MIVGMVVGRAASRFTEAGVTAAICARVGALEAPVWVGHVIHLCRDTAYGCEVRSRFWLGDFDSSGGGCRSGLADTTLPQPRWRRLAQTLP